MPTRTLSPSERVDQTFETHAHAHDRHLAHEVIDSVARNPRVSGAVVWAGRFNERVDLQLREKLREMGSLRLTVTSVPRRDLLVQVPSKEVEVVFMSASRGRARLAGKVMTTVNGRVVQRRD